MLHNNKHCTLLLYIIHQLKPPLLLYIRVLLMIYLGQKHPFLPNPERIVSIKPAVNHIFFLGFRMKSHIFNDVILVLKMLIYSVNFYFAFFHYFVPPNSNVTAASHLLPLSSKIVILSTGKSSTNFSSFITCKASVITPAGISRFATVPWG